MPTCVMASLAELGCLEDQQLRMIAPMRCMAIQAIFLDRGMLKHEGPSLLRVAFVAQFIHRIGFDLFGAEGPMGIVTAGALDQPFFNWMMGLPICL